MLPIAITLGAFLFLVLWFVRPLAEHVEPGFSVFAKQIQPILIAIMLFLQFNRVSPHDLRFRKWHFVLLGFQVGIFALLTLLAVMLPEGNGRILVESAMLCFICPTASAAGVVTSKLGGSLSDTVSYVVMINISVALVVPLAIPIVNTASDVPFMTSFLAICMKIFPLLVLPLIIAWIVRYTMRRLQRWLMRYTEWAFYCWGVALCFAIYLATRALVLSGLSVWVVLLIGVISLVCTLAQFGVGLPAGFVRLRSMPMRCDLEFCLVILGLRSLFEILELSLHLGIPGRIQNCRQRLIRLPQDRLWDRRIPASSSGSVIHI